MNEELIKRIQVLIEKGENIKTQRYVERPRPWFSGIPSRSGLRSNTSRGDFVPYVEPGAFEEWRTNALSLIEGITDPESIYQRNFQEEVNEPHVTDVDKGVGILRALKNDIEQGYLTKYRFKVVAEVFDNLLEMAEHLLELENTYKDLTAFLVGVVLEDGLRQLCGKNNIQIKKDDDISCLNQKLAGKEIYNKITQKNIQAWKAIRDSADHGKFDEYKKEDVQDMLKWVKRFLGENLK
jgi:hypothetical protein